MSRELTLEEAKSDLALFMKEYLRDPSPEGLSAVKVRLDYLVDRLNKEPK